LLDNIVGTSRDESGILIDLGGGCVSEPNGRADLTGLNEFKQWHCGFSLGGEMKQILYGQSFAAP
jgi:hypothetical protein